MPSFDASLASRYAVAGKIAQLNGSGNLPIAQGGTGAATAAAARATLGVPNLTGANNFSAGDLTISGGNFVMDRSGDAVASNTYWHSDAGLAVNLRLMSGATARWIFGKMTGAEGGSNAGADFHFQPYSDAGSAIGGPALTLTRATKLATFGYGIVVGAPTGGDKGAGAINAVAVYDDNVLLTCVPMQPEFLAAGTVDVAKWDAVSPLGHHPVAHDFAKLLDSGFDPRDPANYIARAKRDAALPGMPTFNEWQHGDYSTGELLSKLWLAVEMLAVAWMASQQRPEET